mmetsp:Transcript_3683/g.5414  ORF Transcript_3683/g.5414 Transcript_3683/m.5414 type:complete len:149 (+) Transcript_3683:115-561(+)
MRPTTAGQEYTRNVLSSLPLQIILYFNTWYSITFFIMNVLLFSYKGWKYYYSTGTLIWEFVMIFLIALIDTARVFFASKGNKTEQLAPLVWSIAMSIPLLVGHSYFLRLQTYVLRFDVIINAVSVVFICVEFILSIITFIGLYRSFRG